MKLDRGQFYKRKNGTIFRVVDIDFKRVKTRCISPCKFKHTIRDRIGRPYTYQYIMKNKDYKNIKRIGTDEILHILFFNEKFKKS